MSFTPTHDRFYSYHVFILYILELSFRLVSLFVRPLKVAVWQPKARNNKLFGQRTCGNFSKVMYNPGHASSILSYFIIVFSLSMNNLAVYCNITYHRCKYCISIVDNKVDVNI